ncbi:MAG: ROK family transcriptional regulator [Alphaproteobacteria bacterium]|nr:ROK family transcriptional regulator [Alphaproteobacteria bacterium]MBU2352162.1 ROK family transcriptional regulator [Alphaproteobacteria bacterium]
MSATPSHLSPSERKVLDVIWRHGPIARIDIGPLTDLSTMSVTRIARELTEHGLLEEGVQRTGARGQPTRPLTVRADAACSAGLYFTNRQVQVGLIDLSGRLLAYETRPCDADSPGEVARAAVDVIEAALARGVAPRDRMLGIGVALPGDFITDRRQINAHEWFPGFRGQDLSAELQAVCPFPIVVENDAACAALGERLVGIGQTLSSYFFCHIGHGIGGGLVLDGRLYRGSNGNAGMIGVQFPNGRPRPSGQDLFATLSAEGVPATDFADLEDLHPQDCPALRAWIVRAANQLRQGLWVTARIIDPDAIIIGGRLPRHLLQEIVARVDDASFCNEGALLPRPKVFASSLGPTAGVVGAAAVPLYERLLIAG